MTDKVDLVKAQPLEENSGLSFMGVTPAGPFYIDHKLAEEWLTIKENVNGRPNSDVIRPYYNGTDLTNRRRNVWVVDFGVDMPLEKAACYELPFEFVRQNVYPVRSRSGAAAKIPRNRALSANSATRRPGVSATQD